MSSAIFYTTAIFLLVIVTLFAPTMAASAIAGEKQRQTLDLLLVTLLPTRKLVLGKLVSAFIYTLFLIVIVWPLILFCLVTGGVAIVEFIVTTLLLMMTAVAFTTVGLFASSLSRTTTNATMLTYGIALPLLLIGPFLGMLPVTIVMSLTDVSYGVEEVVNVYGWSLAASLNPISAAVYSAVLRIDEGGWFLIENSISAWPNYLIYPWVVYMLFYGFLAWFLTQLTIRRLERMSR
jgi:ABC-type transport system involved in multi-copper enzyme maturation permease subunit